MIKKIQDCKTVADFLKLKYVNPSYGGETNPYYEEQRRDEEYDDSFKAWFRCKVTNKLYWLTVIDAVVSVEDEGTSVETFHIVINVSNKSIWKLKDNSFAYVHPIVGNCESPFKGARPTEYANVECAYVSDLRVFDDYDLEFPVEEEDGI